MKKIITKVSCKYGASMGRLDKGIHPTESNIILHEKQYSDKRKKVSKFFLQDGAKTISPVLNYNEMNNFILGMDAMQKLTNNK